MAFIIKNIYLYQYNLFRIYLLIDKKEGESTMNKTAIIILAYNNLNYNIGCLESIRKYTTKGTYEVIFVDNNSTDGTREWLKQQPDIKVVLNSENYGFPKGCNIGIEVADKECDIMLLNNDVEVCPRWLENMQTALYSDQRIGAVGAATSYDFKGALNAKGEEIDFDSGNMCEIQAFAEGNNVLDPRRWKYRMNLIGFCMLIRRDVLKVVGLLDERFSPGTFEDDDISLRIISAGYRLMVCYDSYIHHFGSKSFHHKTQEYWQLITRNSSKFIKKWGFNSEEKYKVRNDLLTMLEEDENKEINVLEIGCGLGCTLMEIKNRYPKVNLYGIENYKPFEKIAKGVAEVSTKTIGEFPLEFEEDFFDYILIGNSLEQVKAPITFLLEIKKYLKIDGFIIASIQNIMHYSVIRNLIGGSWKYAQGDVLMRSNSLFLTSQDIVTLLTQCGYNSPYIYHWYCVNPADEEYVQKLCQLGDASKEYLFRTYEYTIKFSKL